MLYSLIFIIFSYPTIKNMASKVDYKGSQEKAAQKMIKVFQFNILYYAVINSTVIMFFILEIT